jgi:HK97 family phage major capsid protein
VPSAQRPAKIQDYIPTTVTSERSAIKYMLETTFTNNSAAASENAALAESALAYTEQSVPIELIGTYLPVTEQAMEDIAQVTALINNRLSLMLAQTKETEILTGNGSTPHFTGFLNASGLQTQAKGADDTYTAIYKGINKVNNTGYANASLVVLNSAEAVTVFTTKDANGNFIYGNPGVFNPNNSSIWGLPILVTNAETAGTALVGDFNLYSQYYQSRGARVDVGLDSDNFTKNKLTVKITERGALVVYRGSAFCQVTGL